MQIKVMSGRAGLAQALASVPDHLPLFSFASSAMVSYDEERLMSIN